MITRQERNRLSNLAGTVNAAAKMFKETQIGSPAYCDRAHHYMRKLSQFISKTNAMGVPYKEIPKVLRPEEARIPENIKYFWRGQGIPQEWMEEEVDI